MEVQEILKYFRKKCPGKSVVALPKDAPTEIICEVDPADQHADSSSAIAAIQKSEAHYHKQAVETYKVLKGELRLYVDDKQILLGQGESYVIRPGQVHKAEGDFTLVQVDSKPGWRAADHFLVKH